MSDRYRIPGPKCRHARSEGFVSWPAINDPAFLTAVPMASTDVCGRRECIDDASEWVRAKTGHAGIHTTFAERDAALGRES